MSMLVEIVEERTTKLVYRVEAEDVAHAVQQVDEERVKPVKQEIEEREYVSEIVCKYNEEKPDRGL